MQAPARAEAGGMLTGGTGGGNSSVLLKDESTINTNKPWLPMVSKWCKMDFAHLQQKLSVCRRVFEWRGPVPMIGLRWQAGTVSCELDFSWTRIKSNPAICGVCNVANTRTHRTCIDHVRIKPFMCNPIFVSLEQKDWSVLQYPIVVCRIPRYSQNSSGILLTRGFKRTIPLSSEVWLPQSSMAPDLGINRGLGNEPGDP